MIKNTILFYNIYICFNIKASENLKYESFEDKPKVSIENLGVSYNYGIQKFINIFLNFLKNNGLNIIKISMSILDNFGGVKGLFNGNTFPSDVSSLIIYIIGLIFRLIKLHIF